MVENNFPRQSSSPDLSSPPRSVSSPPRSNGNSFVHEHLTSQTSNPTEVAGASKVLGGSKAAKDSGSAPKRRKKKDTVDGKSSTNDQENGDAKPKKPRIPRGTGPRAMKKKAEEEAKKAAEAAAASAAIMQTPQPQNFIPKPTPPPPPTNHPLLAIPAQSEKGNHEAIHNPQSYKLQQSPNNHQPRPSSGQNYDPIRSATVATRPESPMNSTLTPPRPAASLSATRSPSILSLIDPPDTMRSYNAYQPPSKRENENYNVLSHEHKRPRLSSPTPNSTASLPRNLLSDNGGSHNVDPPESKAASLGTIAMPTTIALVPAAATTSKKPSPNISKDPSPASHSPKPTARKEPLPLPAAGSGLLTGAIFGAAGGLEVPALEKIAPTVVINIPLTGDHQYINFTRMAEEKYGFDALHPRLAAQRERLARVAAAGAALEKARKNGSGISADEMSEDLSNDEGDNSNVDMSGMVGSKSGEDGEKPTKKKRLTKEDMYDVDDDFIDDTEQAWEEQAAVSMDGFFVYSGPLVPEGEEPKVERSAESAPKRTRGGGKGSRGGAASRAGRGASSAANKDTKEEKEVKRRVRRSKEQIERDKREAEEKKAQKEKLTLLASKPAAGYLPPQPGQLQFQAQQMAT